MTQVRQTWNGLGLIGFGELGRQIALLAAESFPGQKITIFDDTQNQANLPQGFRSCGFEAYKNQEYAELGFLVCIGYKHLSLKAEIVNWLTTHGRAQPVLVHRTAYIHPTAKIDPGAIIYPMVNIDKEVKIGPGVLLNNSVVVSHNSSIDSCSYLAPGVVLSGHVTLGKSCFIGSGSVFANGVIIGDRCVIGIGSVVTRDLNAEAHAIGNPLKIVKRPIRLN